ncbi:restriction endonuclease subunit S [Paenibacillus terrae]|uniref:restriction endonuclease subunit S n=1 Tax=Paenibacillus terrae TaxID=159743 RepID=UPI0011EB718A|nr:restriction endonuclease subunit S [Paenibacillus terrae]
MSEHKENVPKMRFPGFTDAWEHRKLSDVAQISSGGTPNRKKNSYWNGTIHWATTAEVNYSVITDTNEKITLEGLNSSSAKLLPIGTILMAMYGQGKTRGKVAILGIEATTNQANANIVVSPIVNNLFIYYQLEKQYEILRNLANEGGQANLSLSIIKNISISVSSNLSEQEKNGNLFKQFDHLITLHQRKLNNIKNLKAGLLQKMFPKNGEDFPEIRFPGFTDAWEQRKLGDIFNVLDGDRGKNYPGESDFYENGETLFLDTGNVKKNGFDFSTKKYITKEKDESLRSGKLELHDFVLTSRGTLGNVAYYDEKTKNNNPSVRINSAMLILRPVMSNQVSEDYMAIVLRGNTIGTFMSTNHVGSAQPHITKRDLIKVSVGIPSTLEEQTQIGTFFKQLDHLITLHERKLEHLQEQKKALLQQMFI